MLEPAARLLQDLLPRLTDLEELELSTRAGGSHVNLDHVTWKSSSLSLLSLCRLDSAPRVIAPKLQHLTGENVPSLRCLEIAESTPGLLNLEMSLSSNADRFAKLRLPKLGKLRLSVEGHGDELLAPGVGAAVARFSALHCLAIVTSATMHAARVEAMLAELPLLQSASFGDLSRGLPALPRFCKSIRALPAAPYIKLEYLKQLAFSTGCDEALLAAIHAPKLKWLSLYCGVELSQPRSLAHLPPFELRDYGAGCVSILFESTVLPCRSLYLGFRKIANLLRLLKACPQLLDLTVTDAGAGDPSDEQMLEIASLGLPHVAVLGFDGLRCWDALVQFVERWPSLHTFRLPWLDALSGAQLSELRARFRSTRSRRRSVSLRVAKKCFESVDLRRVVRW